MTEKCVRRRLPSNPQMQPTGRGGPGLRVGARFPVAKQWKRLICVGGVMIAGS
jgi:hypothetical protein